MRHHSLSFSPESATREQCIPSVETYLMEHAKRRKLSLFLTEQPRKEKSTICIVAAFPPPTFSGEIIASILQQCSSLFWKSTKLCHLSMFEVEILILILILILMLVINDMDEDEESYEVNIMYRTMAQRRQAVIRLLDKNLKKEFSVGNAREERECDSQGLMKDFLEELLEWYGVAPKGRTASDHLHQLLHIKRERNEVILEETE